MNTITNANDISVVFPDGIQIVIPRKSGESETLEILPLPFIKWKKGIKYIAQIAPLLGFDLLGAGITGSQAENTATGQPGAENDLILELPDTDKIDQTKIAQALMGDGAEIIYEFLAFAIGKDVSFFDDIYAEAVDITMAVIKVNLNFFIHSLLPRIKASTKELVTVAQAAKAHVNT